MSKFCGKYWYPAHLVRNTSSFIFFSGTRHAKKSCFIIFGTQVLCNLCGPLLIVGFITNFFKETGSILSEKDSSLAIAVISAVANVVFLLIVEQFNRRVCIRCWVLIVETANNAFINSNSQTLYIWSSLLTTASYGLFLVYGYFWSKQSGFEWMPPICIGAVFFFGSMGILPLPYIYSAEILPKKVNKYCLFEWFSPFI